MFCPICDNVRMREVERDNVLIDICPSCKGVWLDRGELEKIVSGLKEEREYYSSYKDERPKYYSEPPKYDKYYEEKEYKKYDKHYHPKHKKKKSMLDIFDIF